MYSLYTHHLLVSAPHTPLKKQVGTTSHKLFIANPENTSQALPHLRLQQDLTTTFPWTISPLDFNNTSFSWLSSDLSASFQDLFPSCHFFNAILRALAWLPFFYHSACSTWLCSTTSVPPSPFLFPAQISLLHTRPTRTVVSQPPSWGHHDHTSNIMCPT